MSFRTNAPLGGPWSSQPPAADGQLGTIVRLYRDWRVSGDDELLRSLWPKVKLSLQYAYEHWEADTDWVPRGVQHNTYDIEFHGANSLVGSLWLAALASAAQMAEFVGDQTFAAWCQEGLRVGGPALDTALWNGEYYVQGLDDSNEYRYQYGDGCLSDQLFGQALAHVAGLGYLLPIEHVRKAIESVFNYNYRASFIEHQSVQRTYALNDERGLVVCSWPNGGRPRFPFPYADEVWSGIEYQVAAHLIYEGLVDEGLTLVEAVRDRHDGYRRNPWNEVECGHHYARSLASWMVYLALTGMDVDVPRGLVTFDPRVNRENFAAFWISGDAWGIYRQRLTDGSDLSTEVEVLYGDPGGLSVGPRLATA
jgi:non-lysosomal glucosylceramidase